MILKIFLNNYCICNYCIFHQDMIHFIIVEISAIKIFFGNSQTPYISGSIR